MLTIPGSATKIASGCMKSCQAYRCIATVISSQSINIWLASSSGIRNWVFLRKSVGVGNLITESMCYRHSQCTCVFKPCHRALGRSQLSISQQGVLVTSDAQVE